MKTTMKEIDVDSELARLTDRKNKLNELLSVQQDVAALEIRLLLGTDAAVTSARMLVDTVCDHYKVPPECITSPSRQERYVLPRHVIFHILRETGSLSLSEIGRIFQRDHSAVCYAVQRIEERLDTEPGFASELAGLRAKFKARMDSELSKR